MVPGFVGTYCKEPPIDPACVMAAEQVSVHVPGLQTETIVHTNGQQLSFK